MREPHPIITQLAAHRKAAGVSRAFVARRIHYVRQSVGYWELGKREPRLDAVDVYARLLGHRLTVGVDGPVVDVLRQARVDAGLTQTDVAIKLNSCLTSVCRWETGQRGMTLTTATAYAALFGLELHLVEVGA
jgi:DNA-binding XRE family transcriptional regulator